MPLTGLLTNWTQMRKESLSQRIYQQTPQKPKRKENKTGEKQNPRTVGQLLQRCYIHITRIPEGEGGEKGTEGISETIMTKDFSNARHQTAATTTEQ